MLENIRSDIRVSVIYYKLYIYCQEITFYTQILTVTDTLKCLLYFYSYW